MRNLQKLHIILGGQTLIYYIIVKPLPLLLEVGSGPSMNYYNYFALLSLLLHEPRLGRESASEGVSPITPEKCFTITIPNRMLN